MSETYIDGIGTVRQCLDCGSLVGGGPTRCKWCAELSAQSKLKRLYEKIKGPDNNVDNVMLAHSLRPHTMVGYMTLYKNVLHNSNNTLPKWYLEALGVYVSYLNNCDYCFDHHFAGLKRLWNDDKKSEEYAAAVKNDTLETFFESRYANGVIYAKKLTLDIQSIVKADFTNLIESGFSEGEIQIKTGTG